jgi:hypothetical protein
MTSVPPSSILNLDALDLGIGFVFLRVCENGVIGLLGLGCGLDPDDHAAGFGFMKNVRGYDLHHHGKAHAVRHLGSFGGRFRDAFLGDWNSVSVADQFAFRRRQAGALICLYRIENFPNVGFCLLSEIDLAGGVL